MIHRRILSPLRAPFLSLALALASAGSLAAPAQPAGAQAEGPRAGTAVAIGGALKLDNAVVWRRLVQEAGGPGARFAVFATASENPERNGARLVGALNAAGARAEFIGVAPRLSGSDAAQAQQLAADPQLAARVAAMQGVFFSGGAQELITATLAPQGRESALLAAVRQVLARGGVVAGTSAGAAIMSEWMFRDAQDALAVLKGRLRGAGDRPRPRLRRPGPVHRPALSSSAGASAPAAGDGGQGLPARTGGRREQRRAARRP
jgi:cyanophycinase